MRGTKLQTTKLVPSNTWCTGGGWCTRPVIGSKSAMLNVYGYRQPSQPTTSNGWVGYTYRVPVTPPAPRCLTSTSTSVALDQQRLGRAVQVALAVRGVLQQLAVARQVALRRGDVRVGLDARKPQRLAAGRDPAVRGGRAAAPRSRPCRAGSAPNTVSTVAAPDSTYTHSSPIALRYSGDGSPGDHVGDAHVGVAEHQPPPGHRRRRPSTPRRGTARAAAGAAGAAGGSARWRGRAAPTASRRRSPTGCRGGRAARSRRRSPPRPSAPRSRGRRRAGGAGCGASAGRHRACR